MCDLFAACRNKNRWLEINSFEIRQAASEHGLQRETKRTTRSLRKRSVSYLLCKDYSAKTQVYIRHLKSRMFYCFINLICPLFQWSISRNAKSDSCHTNLDKENFKSNIWQPNFCTVPGATAVKEPNRGHFRSIWFTKHGLDPAWTESVYIYKA